MNRTETVLKCFELSGLKVRQYCRESGFSHSQYYNWANGLHRPHVYNVEAAAAAIGKKVLWKNKSQTECELVDVLPEEPLSSPRSTMQNRSGVAKHKKEERDSMYMIVYEDDEMKQYCIEGRQYRFWKKTKETEIEVTEENVHRWEKFPTG